MRPGKLGVGALVLLAAGTLAGCLFSNSSEYTESYTSSSGGSAANEITIRDLKEAATAFLDHIRSKKGITATEFDGAKHCLVDRICLSARCRRVIRRTRFE